MAVPLQRLSRRDTAVDALIALGMGVGAAVSAQLYRIFGMIPASAEPGYYVLWALAISVPLAFRRRWPVPMLAIVSVAFFVGQTVVIPEVIFSNISLFLAIVTVGSREPRRKLANWSRGLVTIGMGTWLCINLANMDPAIGPPEADTPTVLGISPLVALQLLLVIQNVLYFSAAIHFGNRGWRSVVQATEIREQMQEITNQQEIIRSQAVSLERLRIARELHDVVAHHVSTIGVQAGAARLVLDSDPVVAKQALRDIENGSRAAITEMHLLLRTLRTPDDEQPDTIGSASSTAGISALVDEAVRLGMTCTLTVVGTEVALPPLIGASVYRVAQEALTNVRKHAAPDAEVSVRMRFIRTTRRRDHSDDDRVELEVANTGSIQGVPPSRGFGLMGMSERVEATGGELHTGPRRGGGFIVRASFRIPTTTEHDPGHSTDSAPQAEQANV